MPQGLQYNIADFERQKRRIIAALRQLENPQPRDVLGRWIRPEVEPAMRDFANWLHDYWGTVTPAQKRGLTEAVKASPTVRYDYEALIFEMDMGYMPSDEELGRPGVPLQPWSWRGVDIPAHLIPQPTHFVPEDRLRAWMEEKEIDPGAFWAIERTLMKRGWFTKHPGRRADEDKAGQMYSYRDEYGQEVLFERVHVDEGVVKGVYGWIQSVCKAAGDSWPG